MTSNTNHVWKITALIATLVTPATIPLYHAWHQALPPGSRGEGASPAAAFVGSEACRDCHRPEYDKWADSHHRWAMEPASERRCWGISMMPFRIFR